MKQTLAATWPVGALIAFEAVVAGIALPTAASTATAIAAFIVLYAVVCTVLIGTASPSFARALLLRRRPR